MKNLLLIPLAIVLVTILAPFGFTYAMFKAPSKSLYFRGIAESIDQLGNHIMQYLFNQWMVRAVDVPEVPYVQGQPSRSAYTQQPYLFGNIDETVSSALGKNKLQGTLTPSGKFLDKILDFLDPNHSIDAVEKNP